MVVATVDDGHAGVGPLQPHRRREAAKPGTDYDDP
jgi:hypothetical protein